MKKTNRVYDYIPTTSQAAADPGASEQQGELALVLHGHLPFVRHPEYERFLEEDWLYEAITETYIPLLGIFDRLVKDGIDFRLTMSLTPTLITMLDDALLRERYSRHIIRLIELSEKEIVRTRQEPPYHDLAILYNRLFTRARSLFEEYNRDLVSAFRKFQDLGKIELITSAATHAFLPLLANPKAVRAQVQVAVDLHADRFGLPPRGIWLPECGYYEGLDDILQESGIGYFVTDAHGIFFATPRPKYGVYAPICCPSGVAAFGRDIESSRQVWSSVEGYPGDYDYRDFYRDIGFDLGLDAVKPYLHEGGLRTSLGIKYYRITGKTEQKEPYDRQRALERAAVHAANFLENRGKQTAWLAGVFRDRKPIIVAPYDAELFGHWWFEGPEWLDQVIRMSAGSRTLRLVTPGGYLDRNPRCQTATPSGSSWGEMGYAEVWLDETNDWIYPHLHMAADRMIELARARPRARGIVRRALNQAARELLLAQSSDWAFIMKAGSHREYAVRRTTEHVQRFTKLYEDISMNAVDEGWLADLEYQDNIFPHIDYRIYA